MKRELKFRAKYQIKIYDVLSIDFAQQEVKVQESNKPIFDAKILTVDFSEVELLEHIGVLDKNGEEIYERDKIRSYSYFLDCDNREAPHQKVYFEFEIRRAAFGFVGYRKDQDHTFNLSELQEYEVLKG